MGDIIFMEKLSAIWKNRVAKLVELIDLNNGGLPKTLAYQCFLTGYSNTKKKQLLFNTTLKIAVQKGLIINENNKMLFLTGEVLG